MEENLERVHQFCLKERREGTLTGVVDVISFDSEQIFLETTQGMLTIRGRELHVSRLQLELGEIDVEGTVDSFVYTEGGSYGRRQRRPAGQAVFLDECLYGKGTDTVCKICMVWFFSFFSV